VAWFLLSSRSGTILLAAAKKPVRLDFSSSAPCPFFSREVPSPRFPLVSSPPPISHMRCSRDFAAQLVSRFQKSDLGLSAFSDRVDMRPAKPNRAFFHPLNSVLTAVTPPRPFPSRYFSRENFQTLFTFSSYETSLHPLLILFVIFPFCAKRFFAPSFSSWAPPRLFSVARLSFPLVLSPAFGVFDNYSARLMSVKIAASPTQPLLSYKVRDSLPAHVLRARRGSMGFFKAFLSWVLLRPTFWRSSYTWRFVEPPQPAPGKRTCFPRDLPPFSSFLF